MVDNGCTVVDVVVEHPLYGQLTGQLSLASRYDVAQFVGKIRDSVPLSALTGGVHLHHLRCPDEGGLPAGVPGPGGAGHPLYPGETAGNLRERIDKFPLRLYNRPCACQDMRKVCFLFCEKRSVYERISCLPPAEEHRLFRQTLRGGRLRGHGPGPLLHPGW